MQVGLSARSLFSEPCWLSTGRVPACPRLPSPHTQRCRESERGGGWGVGGGGKVGVGIKNTLAFTFLGEAEGSLMLETAAVCQVAPGS